MPGSAEAQLKGRGCLWTGGLRYYLGVSIEAVCTKVYNFLIEAKQLRDFYQKN